jgi:regulator of RNase E activity RraA
MYEIEDSGFSVFSLHLTVAHGNPHVIHFARPVQIDSLTITTGDIICADRHGVILVPKNVLPHLEKALAEVERRVSPVLRYCQTPGFTPQGVADRIEHHMRKAPRWTPPG